MISESEFARGLRDDERANRIVTNGEILYADDGYWRRTKANAALVLYHGGSHYTFDDASHGLTIDDLFAGSTRTRSVAYNLIQAATDTKTNHIVRNRVRPMIVTEAGDSELQEKAKGMQRAVEAHFDNAGLWSWLGALVCKHGNTFGTGGVCIRPDRVNHRLKTEIVYQHELLLDPEEARRNNPRRVWWRRTIAREELLAEYDDRATRNLIEAAKPVDDTDGGSISDRLLVWEYWHLPSGHVDLSDKDNWKDKPPHDGIYCRVLDGNERTMIEQRAYPFDRFPISLFRTLRPPTGFFGCGVPERLGDAQLKVNEINQRIDEIIHFHAVPRFIVSKAAKINTAKLTNGTASVFEVRGSPHQAAMYLTPQSVPSELFARVDEIIRWSEKQIGLSEMSIAAMKPKGVDHAPGMQHLADTESIRHTDDFREWESFSVDCSHAVIEGYRTLAEIDPDYEIVFGASKQLRRIKWKSVDLGRDRYHLRTWPTNLLPQTPAAKKSAVMDLFNAGFFTKEQAALALDFPDVEAVSGDTTAATENIERLIDDAKAGKDAIPEPYMNLGLAQTMIVNAINRAEADRESEERVDRLRELWQLTDALTKKMAAEAAMVAAGQPPGAPMAAAPPAPPPPPPGMN